MKKIIVTPAGRSVYLSILAKYLVYSYNIGIFDEWHLWVNTNNQHDIEFMQKLERDYSFIKLVFHPKKDTNINYSIKTIHDFFQFAMNEDAIYLRLDDDICYAHPKSIQNIFYCRTQNPAYFLISGNVVNNAICSHLHQNLGALGKENGIVGYLCMDKLGWADPFFANYVHESAFPFLSIKPNDYLTNRYMFNEHILQNNERISINAICWFGKDMKKINGEVGEDEEEWLTVTYPREAGLKNMICGKSLFVHFAFMPQRQYLEERTNWLKRYDSVAKRFLEYL